MQNASYRLYQTIKTAEIGKEMKDNCIQKEREINLRKGEIGGKHSEAKGEMRHITIRYERETYGYRGGGLRVRTPKREKDEK